MDQAIDSGELIDYTNAIFSKIIVTIVEEVEKLGYEDWSHVPRERQLLFNIKVGIQWHAFLMLKFKEGDRSYAFEHVERYWDFKDQIPIAQLNETHLYY